MPYVLEIKDLTVGYDTGLAVKDINLQIEDGSIVSLIGANGAGKSSLLKAISGIIQPAAGEIIFQGQNITHWKPFKIVKAGIAQVPEGGRIFTKLTVIENLKTGAYLRYKKDTIEKILEKVFEHFPRLKERISQKAGTLSGGERQMLAFGRAMMASPKILLLDEPSLGLSPIMVQEIFNIIKAVKSDGYTILLVEQNARKALRLADRAYVIQTGKIVLEGVASDLLNNEEVKSAYLGV